MSTPNFHKTEAPFFYVLNIPVEDLEDDFLVESFVDDAKWTISDLLGKKYDYYNQGSDPYELRSYPAEAFASISKRKTYAGLDVEIKINLIIRSGYYAGCNLDYVTQIFLDGDLIGDMYRDALDPFDFIEMFSYNYPEKKGMAKIVAPKAFHWINDTYTQMVKDVQEAFKNASTRYRCSAIFSNGKAVYTKI